MDKLSSLFADKRFIFNSCLIRAVSDLNLTEFLILVYLDNTKVSGFDVDDIVKTFNLSKDIVMDAFNSLLSKNLVKMDTSLDIDGRINEVISLSSVYTLMSKSFTDKEVSSDIFNKFEHEFGRSLSPTEYEVINGWLSTGTSEELILGALKESVFNGVRSLRYIDKMLYEWGKKGFQSMDDVNDHLKNKDDESSINNNEELFDYNWLDDDE